MWSRILPRSHSVKRYGQAEKTHTDSVLQTENKIVNLQERKKI